MDVGDVTDPNLDGDFQALLEARQKRQIKSENDAIIRELVSDRDNQNNEVDTAVLPSYETAVRSRNDTTSDIEQLRNQLFQAVDNDDVKSLRTDLAKVSEFNLSLSSPQLRAPADKRTILHAALEGERWNTARLLISTCDESLLTDYYNVTIRDLPSKKYCLHILSEKGSYELAKTLLERLENDATKNQMLNQTVTMEVEGQRPRPLACIHIAALNGHTELIELFEKMGVDVNTVNNKNDTPVLWAARGNHLKTVKRLIKLGADVLLENDKGSTPLYWAVRYGFADLVRLLATESKVNVHQQRKLGLVSPIVLAAALGYAEIVGILLEHGAEANTKIKNDMTALHVAAAEGNNDVVIMLLEKGHADINQADANGNTALLFAAKAGNMSTIKLLIENKAQLDGKNKMGQNIWDFAMQHSKEFLEALAELYKRASRPSSGVASGTSVKPSTSKRKLVFPVGRTPLHVAAASGDVDKIRCLFELGADPKARDLNGNTYFHIAAMNDRDNVLNAFMSEVDVEATNLDGNTALHLAAKTGRMNCVQLLLKVPKVKLEARNKLGMTPLHEAVDSDAVSAVVIKAIVEVVIKASNWSLVNARDNRDNTALHIAARRSRADVLRELAPLNPTLVNADGDTPFHLAARVGAPHCLETMLEVFNRAEKGLNIDQINADGESMLHIAARRGDLSHVELLVSAGADLALQNKAGNTVLHALVEEITTQPHKHESVRQVLRTVTLCSARWWCMKKDLQYPSEESELHNKVMRTAMIHLTSDIYNKSGLNVLAFATQSCAADFLSEILNTPNVYRFKEVVGDYVFDITNLTPQTMARSKRKESNHRASVGVIGAEYMTGDYSQSTEQLVNSSSCLDVVTTLSDEVQAAKILDINPFKTLVHDYWSAYQWIYGVLILVHIAYMILFSVFVTPTYAELSSLYNTTATTNALPQCRPSSTTALYGLFLIWPLLILVFEVYSLVTELVRNIRARWRVYRSRRANSSDNASDGDSISVFGLPYKIMLIFFDYISHLTAIAFSAMVIAWYATYVCPSPEQSYVEVVSMVFIFGWLFSMSFTKGFEELHMFTIMLKYIVIRDITRFLLIYLFVLLGCGLAFHTLFQLSSVMAAQYPTPWMTLFNSINLMMGLGALFDDSFDETYYSAGGNPAFVKCVYIFYIILANIILMSLLIAMLTDTYTEIKSKEGTTWRVGSLRLALRVERSMPCLKNLLIATRLVRDRIVFDVNAERWTITVSAKEIGNAGSAAMETDELIRSVQRLENKLDHLTGAYTELSRQVEGVSQLCLSSGDDSSGATHPHTAMVAAVGMRTGPSFYNTVLQIRERPFSGKGSKK